MALHPPVAARRHRPSVATTLQRPRVNAWSLGKEEGVPMSKSLLRSGGRLGLVVLWCALIPCGRSLAATIDFESMSATAYYSGSAVPAAAQLSDQLVSATGAKFTSSGGYVAVVELGTDHATSGINGIGGSTQEGTVSYAPSNPIEISFFDPANPSRPATTDFVSVRGDLWASGRPAIAVTSWARVKSSFR